MWIWAFSFCWPFGKFLYRKLIWASKSLTSILGSQKIKIKIWISMDLYESPKSAWEGESKSNKQKTWKERSLFLIFIFGMILSCFLIANQRLWFMHIQLLLWIIIKEKTKIALWDEFFSLFDRLFEIMSCLLVMFALSIWHLLLSLITFRDDGVMLLYA